MYVQWSNKNVFLQYVCRDQSAKETSYRHGKLTLWKGIC